MFAACLFFASFWAISPAKLGCVSACLASVLSGLAVVSYGSPPRALHLFFPPPLHPRILCKRELPGIPRHQGSGGSSSSSSDTFLHAFSPGWRLFGVSMRLCVFRLYCISKPKTVWVKEIEAAGLSSQERLTLGLDAVQEAKDLRAAGRLNEASRPFHSSSVQLSSAQFRLEGASSQRFPYFHALCAVFYSSIHCGFQDKKHRNTQSCEPGAKAERVRFTLRFFLFFSRAVSIGEAHFFASFLALVLRLFNFTAVCAFVKLLFTADPSSLSLSLSLSLPPSCQTVALVTPLPSPPRSSPGEDGGRGGGGVCGGRPRAHHRSPHPPTPPPGAA